MGSGKKRRERLPAEGYAARLLVLSVIMAFLFISNFVRTDATQTIVDSAYGLVTQNSGPNGAREAFDGALAFASEFGGRVKTVFGFVRETEEAESPEAAGGGQEAGEEADGPTTDAGYAGSEAESPALPGERIDEDILGEINGREDLYGIQN